MGNKLALKICKYLSKNDAINEDLKDVYAYGFEILLSFVFSVLVILIIGLLTNNIIVSLTYLFVFIITRRYVGGYHASTYFRCQLCSFIVFSTVMLLTCYIDVGIFMIYVLAIIGIIFILIWAPIENPNKPISRHKQKKYKIYGIIIFFITSIVSLIVRNLNMMTLCNAVVYTQTAVIALMIYPLLLRKEER